MRAVKVLKSIRLYRLLKNTKFGNRIRLVSSGKSAPGAGSENEVITHVVRVMHFSAACSAAGVHVVLQGRTTSGAEARIVLALPCRPEGLLHPIHESCALARGSL